MGVFKSLVDRAKEKRDELAKKAAKKAAKTALEESAKAALGAIDGAGKAIERALFGDAEEQKKGDLDVPDEEKPDPFAKLKAAEAAKAAASEDSPRRGARVKERAMDEAARAAKHDAEEKEIDAELAELKRKLGK
jgi:hypothetical protein